MLQAKLLNVDLKYYNKEKNANRWILKNSTHLLVATISKFKLKGKHFKRRALKTYILQGITYKFKNSKFSAFSELVKSQKSCWSLHFPQTFLWPHYSYIQQTEYLLSAWLHVYNGEDTALPFHTGYSRYGKRPLQKNDLFLRIGVCINLNSKDKFKELGSSWDSRYLWCYCSKFLMLGNATILKLWIKKQNWHRGATGYPWRFDWK